MEVNYYTIGYHHNDLLFDVGSKTLTALVVSHMLPLHRHSKGPFTLYMTTYMPVIMELVENDDNLHTSYGNTDPHVV